MTSSSNFFDALFFLIKFSYWSKFYVNIITGSKLLTLLWRTDQKSGIWKYLPLSFPKIWRLGRVRDTKVCTIISNKMLLNAVKILFEERSHIFRGTVTMVVADNLASSTLGRFFYNFSTVKNVICFYNFLK